MKFIGRDKELELYKKYKETNNLVYIEPLLNNISCRIDYLIRHCSIDYTWFDENDIKQDIYLNVLTYVKTWDATKYRFTTYFNDTTLRHYLLRSIEYYSRLKHRLLTYCLSYKSEQELPSSYGKIIEQVDFKDKFFKVVTYFDSSSMSTKVKYVARSIMLGYNWKQASRSVGCTSSSASYFKNKIISDLKEKFHYEF